MPNRPKKPCLAMMFLASKTDRTRQLNEDHWVTQIRQPPRLPEGIPALGRATYSFWSTVVPDGESAETALVKYAESAFYIHEYGNALVETDFLQIAHGETDEHIIRIFWVQIDMRAGLLRSPEEAMYIPLSRVDDYGSRLHPTTRDAIQTFVPTPRLKRFGNATFVDIIGYTAKPMPGEHRAEV